MIEQATKKKYRQSEREKSQQEKLRHVVGENFPLEFRLGGVLRKRKSSSVQ